MMTRRRCKEVAEVLMSARDVLRERRWWRNALSGPAGEVCAAGAVNCAAYGSPWPTTDNKARDAISLACELLWGYQYQPLLGDWNDAADRTQEEVEALLADAASLALSEAHAP